ncbi:Uncharacterised protein [Salmonella enterica subsp. enterica serovar Bovismorbificans]|uniref:Uncharacterized protein n=1 Tax=Salmonella enterica subsp. enterica serovar Bovismorbificans TaxID=58097 RepID=A0A655E8E1_SALET|nr:Uncharacterised protein [Salmonella enterica subsp. enterica serovar Bovismorbificans]
MQTDQHYRAVDQEADDNHTSHINVRVSCRVHPVNDGRDSHQGHKEYAGRATVAAEDFIRHPATQQRARNTRVFIQEVGPGGFIQCEMLHFFQVGRRPVENTVAQQVDEHVGDSDIP